MTTQELIKEIQERAKELSSPDSWNVQVVQLQDVNTLIAEAILAGEKYGREGERGRAEKLWDILDDIDSLPDAIHPNTSESHEKCWKMMVNLAHNRHSILATDGYKLFLPKTN